MTFMNPYTKTNFGNTHIELLNLPSLKKFTYVIPGLYLKPIMSKNPTYQYPHNDN